MAIWAMATQLKKANLAQFIANCNAKRVHHIGYCGKDAVEILESLNSDFSDLDFEQSFIIAEEKGEIIAAIGLDVDEAEQTAEVWGPFCTLKDAPEMIKSMWNALIYQLPLTIKTFNFFINNKNEQTKTFVESVGASNMGSYLNMVFHITTSNDFSLVNHISKLKKREETSFITLHNSIFPNTYYNGQTIIQRSQQFNCIFAYYEEVLKGYVYIEVEPKLGIGSIEYIAVQENYRQQGIGKKLLHHALSYISSYDEIARLHLTVREQEKAAIRLYESVGFKAEEQLNHFVFQN